jgi:hypothetical protein
MPAPIVHRPDAISVWATAKPAHVGIGLKRALGPIRPRSFRVHANYLDALNASRVPIHRQKPKALDLKFGCGFTWHLPIKVLRLRKCCGVPWRAFFFAVMGCSGLARTGIAPI